MMTAEGREDFETADLALVRAVLEDDDLAEAQRAFRRIEARLQAVTSDRDELLVSLGRLEGADHELRERLQAVTEERDNAIEDKSARNDDMVLLREELSSTKERAERAEASGLTSFHNWQYEKDRAKRYEQALETIRLGKAVSKFGVSPPLTKKQMAYIARTALTSQMKEEG